jgi:hypothetical protein
VNPNAISSRPWSVAVELIARGESGVPVDADRSVRDSWVKKSGTPFASSCTDADGHGRAVSFSLTWQ